MTRLLPLLVVLLSAHSAALRSASAADADADRWQFFLTPYIWAENISGELGAEGASVDIDVGFKDILEQLNFALMGLLEARRGDWIVSADLVAARLSDEIDTGPVTVPIGPPALGGAATLGPAEVDVTSVLATLDLKLGRRMYSRPLSASLAGGRPREARSVDVDVFAGLRYWYVSTELDVELPVSISGGGAGQLPRRPLGKLRLPAGLPAASIDRDFDESVDWVDPVIGFRVSADLTDRLSLALIGDIGGFDLGSASESTWQASATLGYRIGERWVLRGGYRALSLERERNDVEIDIVLHGLIVGATYAF